MKKDLVTRRMRLTTVLLLIVAMIFVFSACGNSEYSKLIKYIENGNTEKAYSEVDRLIDMQISEQGEKYVKPVCNNARIVPLIYYYDTGGSVDYTQMHCEVTNSNNVAVKNLEIKFSLINKKGETVATDEGFMNRIEANSTELISGLDGLALDYLGLNEETIKKMKVKAEVTDFKFTKKELVGGIKIKDDKLMYDKTLDGYIVKCKLVADEEVKDKSVDVVVHYYDKKDSILWTDATYVDIGPNATILFKSDYAPIGEKYKPDHYEIFIDR